MTPRFHSDGQHNSDFCLGSEVLRFIWSQNEALAVYVRQKQESTFQVF